MIGGRISWSIRIELHLVHVEETRRERIVATGADVAVRIRGNSFFTGDEAFKKAVEVRDLVAALDAVGVAGDCISLIGVRADTAGGLTGKHSSVEYRLAIRCQSTDLVGPVVAAALERKNAHVGSIYWRFADLDSAKHKLLDECVAAVKATSQSIAQSLGTTVLAVHELKYEVDGGQPVAAVASDVMAFAGTAKARKASEALSGLNLAHVENLSVTVKAAFSVAAFGQ